MPLSFQTIVDISLELDPKNYSMRTPAGFKKDMQFEMEVLKEHDAPGGAGQIVRGVHMRLHAGSHVDAPEHNVRGGTQIHQLPLELFMGDAIVADLRDKLPEQGDHRKGPGEAARQPHPQGRPAAAADRPQQQLRRRLRDVDEGSRPI